jgi:hypothetical protein
MGVMQSPNIAQQIMEEVLHDISKTDPYINDIGVFNMSWTEHMHTLSVVLQRLQDNEKDRHNHCTTQPPRSQKKLCLFIGAVTFYRDMFRRQLHLLAPLTDQVGKKKFFWNNKCQSSFPENKATLAQETLLRYPDHNLPCHVYTDASDYQLGSVIIQNGHPIAFFSFHCCHIQRILHHAIWLSQIRCLHRPQKFNL